MIENGMVGIHFACALDDPDTIRLSEEHDDYRWLTAAEVDMFLPGERMWLKNLVARSELLRKSLSTEIINYNHTHGFEF